MKTSKNFHFFFSFIFVLLTTVEIFSQAGPKRKISNLLFEIINKDGISAAIEKYESLKSADTALYIFNESELNNLGYQLVYAGRISEAIEIFRLNIATYPDYANGFDSMGEVYMIAGQKEKAIEYYKKAIALDSNIIYGARILYHLEHYDKNEYDIPMRDGIKLKTIVYSPVDKSRSYPFLMIRTPYGINPYGENEYRPAIGPTAQFAKEGYIFVYQDVRGKYMSEGKFEDMRPFIPNKKSNEIDECTDTYDTVEWLLKNIPNNNGLVGMWGISYPGFYALMGALSKHPAIAAISPQAPPTDWFIGDDFHRNGAFDLLQSVNFLRTNGVARPEPTTEDPERILTYPTPDLYSFFLKTGPLKNWNEKYFHNQLAFWDDIMTHGSYDEFWKERNILPHLKDIKTAVLNVGGWYDAEDLYGAVNSYKEIEKNNTGIINRIVVGPWYHGGWARHDGDRLGEIFVNSSAASDYYINEIELPFFEFYLKGKGEPAATEALIYDTGTCTWNSYSEYPPKLAAEKKFYLSEKNNLTETVSRLNQPDQFDEFLSDPSHPVPYSYRIENSWNYRFMLTDQRFAAQRPDVLYYETETLQEDLTFIGEIEAELSVSTTGTDADWFVKIIDVYPEDEDDYKDMPALTHMGEYQSLVRLGVMRGKFRNSFEKPEPFVPGEITKVKFKLDDVCHTFKKGHKLMVQIQCTCFPLFDINPQKFVDIYNADEKDFHKATQRVYLGGNHPSLIKVNILNESAK